MLMTPGTSAAYEETFPVAVAAATVLRVIAESSESGEAAVLAGLKSVCLAQVSLFDSGCLMTSVYICTCIYV